MRLRLFPVKKLDLWRDFPYKRNYLWYVVVLVFLMEKNIDRNDHVNKSHTSPVKSSKP